MNRYRDERSGNWFWLDNVILDSYGAQIGPYGLAMYCVIARYADNETDACFPSIKTLAKSVGISYDSAKRGLKALEEAGLVEVRNRYREDGSQTSNECVLLALNAHSTPPTAHSMGGPSSQHGDPPAHSTPINKTQNKQDSEEQEKEKSTKKEKITALSQEEAKALLDQTKPQSINEALMKLIRLRAEENKTGKMSWTAAWHNFGEPYLAKEEKGQLGEEAWLYGLEAAYANGAPHINYAYKAAKNYDPSKHVAPGKEEDLEEISLADEDPYARDLDWEHYLDGTAKWRPSWRCPRYLIEQWNKSPLNKEGNK